MQEYKTTTISGKSLPDELDLLHKKPTQLFAKGDISLLNTKPRVGIVGARKFTPYGRAITDEIASKLARAGVTIISGLALGVDSIAHKSAVEAGGKTIAILPCGIETVYPSSHRNLAMQILQRDGLIISEYPGKTLPAKYQFLERNRLIASLSDILIITEAANASGSLHTAGFALDMGVQIMAVPGNIDSPYSGGTNKLIQNGAYPLLSVDDVLLALGIDDKNDQLAYIPENRTEKVIIDHIKSGKNNIHEILHLTDISSSEIQTTLTMLEIKGVLICQSSRWYIK